VRRAIAALILAAACWTAIWWRPALPPPPDADLTIEARPVAFAEGEAIGPFRITGAWHLVGSEPGFDSLSALAILPDGRFFAVGDRSYWFRFPRPGRPGAVELGGISVDHSWGKALMGDSESVVFDAPTGRWWTSFENYRAIMRADPDGRNVYVVPAMMREWDVNQGAETLVRLSDGRFITVAEGVSAGRDHTHAGLIFASDPLESGDPMPFHLAMPRGVKPVDGALLPDGRVLILGRDFGLGGFVTTLAIADPAELKIGAVWHAREIARLRDWRLADNYEGVAVENGGHGKTVIWLVSDDNQAKVLQRTMLLRMEAPEGAL